MFSGIYNNHFNFKIFSFLICRQILPIRDGIKKLRQGHSPKLILVLRILIHLYRLLYKFFQRAIFSYTFI